MRPCWCGSDGLEPFSDGYVFCRACGTLVSRAVETVGYGSDYWYSHQQAGLGQPSIEERARLDLPERCTHWLRLFLKACLPPGDVLELGCAHGGFTALLARCGFRARGLELDASVAALASSTFGVEMLTGPLEEQEIPAGSLSAVALMDVLEHLPDPLGLLRLVGRLLAPGGVAFVQTPRLPEGKSFEELQADGDPFLNMLLPAEHLHLFSERAARELFARAGLGRMRFEQTLFPYDMLFCAAPQALEERSAAQAAECLCSTPDGRVMLALLDLEERARRAEALAGGAGAAEFARGGGLEGVVRAMASGQPGEPRLAAALNGAFMRLGRVGWFCSKALARLTGKGDPRRTAAPVDANPDVQASAVQGLHGDGWCGPRLLVAFAPGAHRQWLRAGFTLPGHAPSARVTITTLVCGRPWGQPVTLARGASVTLDPDLPPGGGCVEFVLDGAARAMARAGSPADRRELSVLCGELRLTDGAVDVDLRYPQAGGSGPNG